MFILCLISVVGKLWSHDEGWCPAVGSVYSATTAALAFHWLCIAAGSAVSWCTVESLPHRNRESVVLAATCWTLSHAHTSVLWPFLRDHLGEPVPEESFWTLWCKGRLTEADTPTIRLGATPSDYAVPTSTISPFFYRLDALPTAQPTVSKHWRHMHIFQLLPPLHVLVIWRSSAH